MVSETKKVIKSWGYNRPIMEYYLINTILHIPNKHNEKIKVDGFIIFSLMYIYILIIQSKETHFTGIFPNIVGSVI